MKLTIGSKVRLAIAPIIAMSTTSCLLDPQEAFVWKDEFVQLRVSSVLDNSPVAGATIIARPRPIQTIAPYVDPEEDAEIPLRPTDSNGETVVPLSFRKAFTSRVFGTLDMSISINGSVESISISLETHDIAKGNLFKVEVINLFSDTPPCPAPVPIIDGDQTLFRVDCYVKLIELCDLRTGQIHAAYRTLLGSPYLNMIDFSLVPRGYFNSDIGRYDCYLTRECDSRLEGDFAITIVAAGNNAVCSSYCLTDHGGIGECSP